MNDDAQQLFISQDIPRGGCQWIVSLSPRLRVIFDGQVLGVGREAWDLGVIDLDKDGVYEITAPITDFYDFYDKMSISQIPLPSIVFKYHPAREEYLPANATFRAHAFEEMLEVPSISNDLVGQFSHRSAVLNNLLIYVYAGEEKTGWEFFNSKYGLSDKVEIQRRVKSILGRQAVYNLIYKRGKN